MSQALTLTARIAGRPAARLRISTAFALVAFGLVGGCTNYDHVIVGSVPDDYRTAHPIVISEQDEKIDIPVGAYDRGVTRLQRTALEGFLDGYDRRAASPLQFLVPVGSANEAAARRVAEGMVRIARRDGVPASRIAMASYQVPSPEAQGPIRVVYTHVKASTNKCGRWPDDLLNNSENKHYADFGCSYQNNLAAQVANPSDLIGPRKQGDIDAERRAVTIGDYRNSVPDTMAPVDDVQYSW
jgi:pilus assembly protein CpaD